MEKSERNSLFKIYESLNKIIIVKFISLKNNKED